MDMRVLLVLAFIISICSAQSCSSVCSNGIEDSASPNFYTKSAWAPWGLAYVRDASMQPIQPGPHPSTITRILIAVHGNNRDAMSTFCNAYNATLLQGNAASTYIVAPHFFNGSDTRPANAFWYINNQAWKEGGKSDKSTVATSNYDVLDDMVTTFATKALFPGVTEIIFVGFGDGANAVQHYAISNGVDTSSGLVRYAVLDANTFAYVENTRPALPYVPKGQCGACDPVDISTRTYTFVPQNTTGCAKPDDWRYGLTGRNAYANIRTLATTRNQYKTRNVTYVVSTTDLCSDLSACCAADPEKFDDGCEARQQGYCRYMRGVIYAQHLKKYYSGPIHRFLYVSDGIDEECSMMTSPTGLLSMFWTSPTPVATTTTSTTTTTATTSTTSTSTTSTTSTTDQSTTTTTTSDTGAATTTSSDTGAAVAATTTTSSSDTGAALATTTSSDTGAAVAATTTTTTAAAAATTTTTSSSDTGAAVATTTSSSDTGAAVAATTTTTAAAATTTTTTAAAVAATTTSSSDTGAAVAATTTTTTAAAVAATTTTTAAAVATTTTTAAAVAATTTTTAAAVAAATTTTTTAAVAAATTTSSSSDTGVASTTTTTGSSTPPPTLTCNCAAPGVYGDDMFQDTGYATTGTTGVAWGLAYARDGSREKIREVHSSAYTRVVIALHGNLRDPVNYYCYAKNAIQDAGLYDSTYLIAPSFPMFSDALPTPNTFFWVNSVAWKEGGRAHTNTSRIASFQILDDIIKVMNNKTLYPSVTQIIVVGHSGGGQAVQRYAMATGVDAITSVPIHFVAENAVTYGYLDSLRPVLPTLPAGSCAACDSTTTPSNTYTFDYPAGCAAYNDWRYGLNGANVYVTRRSNTLIRNEYRNKDVTYVVGSLNTCTQSGTCGCDNETMDASCEAHIQGYCPLERGVAFYQYLKTYYGAQVHKLVVVPGVDHDPCTFMRNPAALAAMFPGISFTTSTSSAIDSTSSASDSGSTSGDSSSSSGSASSTTGENTPAPTPSPTPTPDPNAPGVCGKMCTGAIMDDQFTQPLQGNYGNWGLAYYRDSSRGKIREVNANYTRAVIIIHGNDRDVKNHYCYAKYAIQDAGLYDSTYLIAPWFPLLSDSPPANAFYWVSSTSWKEGGKSNDGTSRIASFQILDDIIVVMNDKALYPNLQEIVVIGHAAGGQTLQSYAISTGVDKYTTVPIRYVPVSPSLFAYLDSKRAMIPYPSQANCTRCNSATTPTTSYSFGTFDTVASNCTGHNTWGYGLSGENQYVGKRDTATIRNEYKTKSVTYVVGKQDTCNEALGNCKCDDNGLPVACGAQAQGYCRLERATIFYQYLQFYYNAPACNPVHALYYADVGTDACGMIRSYATLSAMFPAVKPPTVPAPTPCPTPSPTPSPATSASAAASTSGAPQGSTSGAPQGSSSGAPQGSTSGAPQGSSSGAPQGSTSGAPQGSTSGAPQGATSGAPQGSSSGAPQGSTSGSPQGGSTSSSTPSPATSGNGITSGGASSGSAASTTGTAVCTTNSCDDSNMCTIDTCTAKGCSYVNVSCARDDPCIQGTCDPRSGCVFTPICASTTGSSTPTQTVFQVTLKLEATIDLSQYGIPAGADASTINTTAILQKFDTKAIAIQLSLSLNLTDGTVQIIGIKLIYVTSSKRAEGQWKIIFETVINNTKSFDAIQKTVANMNDKIAEGSLELGLAGVTAPTATVESYKVVSQPIPATPAPTSPATPATTKQTFSSGNKLSHSFVLFIVFILCTLFM